MTNKSDNPKDFDKFDYSLYYNFIIMKKIYIGLSFFWCFTLFSQFNYQSIIKDSNGSIVSNQAIDYKISFIYDSSSASPTYSEIHSLTTPSDGVINLVIGNGTVQSGTFSTMDWSKTIYVKREVDLTGSGTFTDFGTSELNSVPKSNYSSATQGISYRSNTVSVTNLIVSNTVTATKFVGDGSGLTGISGPIYKSSMVLQSSSTAAADSQIDLPGLSFRWRKDSNNLGKLEVKAESGNAPQALIFYFSYHTNSGNTVNYKPDTTTASTSSWSAVDDSWDNTLPSITGAYAVYEFDFTVYPLNSNGNHFGKTYNVKLFLDGWGGVHIRAFYQ